MCLGSTRMRCKGGARGCPRRLVTRQAAARGRTQSGTSAPPTKAKRIELSCEKPLPPLLCLLCRRLLIDVVCVVVVFPVKCSHEVVPLRSHCARSALKMDTAAVLLTAATVGLAVRNRGPMDPRKWNEEWRRLVGSGAIAATTEAADGRRVYYGVCLDEDTGIPREFCQDADTSKSLQLPARETAVGDSFRVILRATRALRPPAAAKLGSLPPHNESECSFCTGPLRLAAREMVAQAVLPTDRVWDVHFNIAPMEPLGHFLLVPEIAEPSGRRSQCLLPSDCCDIFHMARASDTLCFNFNSPGAGASQNHLHLHAWVISASYGCLRAPALAGTTISLLGGVVELCVLNWPASCVRLRGG
jgi:hypothetical protein